MSESTSETSAGTVQARIITGAGRMQVLVNGAWYDVEGVAMADLLTSDARYAGRVTFTKIGAVAKSLAGGARTPVAKIAQSVSSAPNKTSSSGTVMRQANTVAPAAVTEPAAAPATPAAGPATSTGTITLTPPAAPATPVPTAITPAGS